MSIYKYILLAFFALLTAINGYASEDYKTGAAYLELRDSVHHSFNDGDSVRFFLAVKQLQDYLLKQGDMHAYYNQRCNEIVFLMNRNQIVEAYKLARQLSKELRERKQDKEMYMAVNMMGHINRYCGNKKAAKQCWLEAIAMMEKEGYYENIPPIYMNIVNVEMTDSPEEAYELLSKARDIAVKHSPERVFDIETRLTVSYFNAGETEKFLEGYKRYREGVEQGLSSVHGRLADVYYYAAIGNVAKAVALAQEMGDEGQSAIVQVYAKAGRWQEAYNTLRKSTEANDSINNVVLTNSVQGIQDELALYEQERAQSKARFITMLLIICLLGLLITALVYIVFSRRRHIKQLNNAYQHALESDRMKTAFIKNVSHEVRTPLNVISGFAQVLLNPSLEIDADERQTYAQMVMKNTNRITMLVDDMLQLSLNETAGSVMKTDHVEVNQMLDEILKVHSDNASPGVALRLHSHVTDDFKLLTNEDMLKHVIVLLLDNALKNTDEGSITLCAQAEGQVLTLAVEDTGCGIPPQEAEHIFERFVKLNDFKEGMGLGLALCRRLVERLGGSIRLDTTYQPRGARFVITLPMDN